MIKRLFQTPRIPWPNKFASLAHQAKDHRLVDYYQCGVMPGNTPLKDIEFVALDIETTGLDPESDGIVSIGTVPFSLSRIRLGKAQHWTVRPKAKLEEGSVVIHGITHNDIVDAPKLNDILEEVLSALSGKIVVVHYRRIEREFLNNALDRMIGEGIEFPVLDTLQIESDYQKKASSGIINRIKGKVADSVRLGQTRRRYGLPDYPPHNALTDAIATAELLQAQVSYHFSPDTDIEDLWL
nr:3'-5' exonuclease [Vibrio gelatinilyticus]